MRGVGYRILEIRRVMVLSVLFVEVAHVRAVVHRAIVVVVVVVDW